MSEAVACQMLRTVEPTCVVCWTATRDPSLSCMHRVCWDCLKKLNNRDCPVCRAHITPRDFFHIRKYNLIRLTRRLSELDHLIASLSSSETSSETSGSDSDFELNLTSEDESDQSEEESDQSEDESD